MGINDYEIPEVEELEPWAQGLKHPDIQFVREFLVDFKAMSAAIRCGWNPETAKSSATRKLRRPVIARAVARAMQDRAEALNITARTVLSEAWHCYMACVGEAKWESAHKFLELIGKHVDVRAFRDRVGLPHDDDVPALNYDALSTDEKRQLLALHERIGAAPASPNGGASRLN
jgi:hypothetical protein